MSKAKEEYLYSKNNFRNDIEDHPAFKDADKYIKELEKQNEYFRLLYRAFNKHVSILEQITGQELDILFGESIDE